MFSNDKTRNIVSFVYHAVILLAGIITTAIAVSQPGAINDSSTPESSLIMFGIAVTALGLNLFRFWKAFNPNKLNKFLSYISYAALCLSMFCCIGIGISNPGNLSSRPLWYGSMFLTIATFATYSILEYVAEEYDSGAKFEITCYGVLIAPIVFFFIGFLVESLFVTDAMVMAISLVVYLVVSILSGKPANMIISGIFIVLYGIFGGTLERFIQGEYYALLPVLILFVILLVAFETNVFTEKVKNSKPIEYYSIVVIVLCFIGCFFLQNIILEKWWKGLLIFAGVLAINGIVLSIITSVIAVKEGIKNKKSSSSSGGTSKTETLVRDKLRFYVKSANYNYARLTQFHITISCTAVDCFITSSGDVQVDADIKFQATSSGALNNTSNMQMIVDAKNYVQNELLKNSRKALETAAAQGAKLSGRFSVNAHFDA